MNIGLIGYGKMGKAIHSLSKQLNFNVKIIIGQKNKEDLKQITRKNIDVAIEFSRPESAFTNIKHCIENNVPVISGTTGWLDQYDDIVSLCEGKNGSFLYASNFSIGVNLFFEFNRIIARKMNKYEDYVCEVEEIHHTEKLDAPSGTAITIAKDIIQSHTTYQSWVNEKSENISELRIKSKRVPKVPGTHIITYSSDIDDIEIKHTAHSRIGFAKGAVTAAKYIKDKKGVFTMRDVLFENYLPKSEQFNA